MSEQPSQSVPFPGTDAIDYAAEQITPPEQTPMDDAAGGHEAEGAHTPLKDPKPNGKSAHDLNMQGGE